MQLVVNLTTAFLTVLEVRIQLRTRDKHRLKNQQDFLGRSKKQAHKDSETMLKVYKKLINQLVQLQNSKLNNQELP